MRRASEVLLVTTLLVSLMPAAGLAQSPPAEPPPRLALGAGAGVAQPLHGDLDFIAGSWEVSLRGLLGRKVAIEGAFGEWRHSRETERRDVPIQGPTGVVGRVGRLTQETSRTGRSFEVNLMALRRIGRVTVVAGGGVGALTMRRVFTQSVAECEPATAHLCGDSRSTFSSSTATVIGLAGVEVPAGSRLSLYGQVKFIAATRDIGASELRYSAGVRLAAWR